MFDIGINTQSMKVSVIQGNNVIKQENLDRERLKTMMSELSKCDVMLEAMRYCGKKFGTKKYLFKEVQ